MPFIHTTFSFKTREKNVNYLSSSPDWFHVNRNYLPRVWEYLYLICIVSYCGRNCSDVGVEVFYKCRYVISSYGNHWDHAELEHISILFILILFDHIYSVPHLSHREPCVLRSCHVLQTLLLISTTFKRIQILKKMYYWMCKVRYNWAIRLSSRMYIFIYKKHNAFCLLKNPFSRHMMWFKLQRHVCSHR